MTGAIIILLVTLCVGLVLYVYDLKYRRMNPGETEGESNIAEPEVHKEDLCCGKHLICEKPLVPTLGEKIEYYDDEELDRFAGKDADGYEESEIEEVRDVMMTLQPSDVAGWVRSIQLRGINLPTPLRDELFILLGC